MIEEFKNAPIDHAKWFGIGFIGRLPLAQLTC
jgi:hypothetical protein